MVTEMVNNKFNQNGNGKTKSAALTQKAQVSKEFAGKRIVILGMARQGMALARFLTAEGAQVTLSDMATAEKIGSQVEEAKALGAITVLGGHPLELLDGCDRLCLSGGVPAQIDLVQEAIRRSIPLSNDSLITVHRARQLGLGPIIAITGSSGKTTTTALTGRILSDSGMTVHVGGNIGTPLIDRMESIHLGEPIVLELSSFQLELWNPALTGDTGQLPGVDIAAITNITPNHLDRHPDMAAYADAKLNLLRTLPRGATVVLNTSDGVLAQLAIVAGSRIAPAAVPEEWHLQALIEEVGAELKRKEIRIVTWGTGSVDGATNATLGTAVRLNGPGAESKEGDALMYNRTVFTWRDKVRLRGDHNLSNILGATAIAGSAGATIESMTRVAESFEGVRHRLEIVAEVNGVTWINDSIATSPERAVAGLRSFDPQKQTIFLLAGGKDKKLPWETFAEESLERVAFLIGFGDAGSMIVEKVQALAVKRQMRMPGTAVVHRLDEAVELAARSANPNTVVLLSPGGTSYDAYRDFEARGEHFRELVAQYAPIAAKNKV